MNSGLGSDSGFKYKKRIIAVLITFAIVSGVVLFAPGAKGLGIQISDPVPKALGENIEFDITVNVNEGELLPIQEIDLNVNGPTTHDFEITNLPLFATSRTYTTLGGNVKVEVSPEGSWGYGYGYGYVEGYGYGYRYAEWKGYGYNWGPGYGYGGYGYGYGYWPGTGYGYGYGYGFSGTQISYHITWQSTSDWPSGEYDFTALVKANGDEFSETKTVALTSNKAPNPPENLTPSGRVTTTSPSLTADVVDNDGDEINVKFYDNSDDSLIDNVWISSGSTASVTWSGLTGSNTYSFYANGTDNNGNTGDNSAVMTFTVNDPPTASFTADDPKLTKENITFDASGSSDSDGSIESYQWDWTNDGTYEGFGTSPKHSYSDDGTYTVKLEVTDSDGATDTTTGTVVVNNRSPTASFSYTPSSPEPGDTITFDASGSSDSDGSIQSYTWDLDNDSQYDDATGQTATDSFSSVGDYGIGLKVTDDDGATGSKYKTVTVSLPNNPPTADADGPYLVLEEADIELDGTGSSDPDGDDLTYSWTIVDDPTGGASLTDASTATPVFQAPSVDSDTDVRVQLTVDDGHGNSDSDTVTVTVQARAPPNESPTANANGPYTVDEEETVTLDGTGSSDPDGDDLSFAWTITSDSTGEAFLTGSGTANPTFHAPSVDSDTEVRVELTVDDGHGHTDSHVAIVTINNVSPGGFPVWLIGAIVVVIIVVILVGGVLMRAGSGGA